MSDERKPLSVRHANLVTQFNNLLKKSNNQVANIENLQKSIRVKEKAAAFAVQKSEFLKKKVISKFGKQAFIELMNDVENYSFNPERFNEANERHEKRVRDFKILQSQNTELKALVRELVEACEFYSGEGINSVNYIIERPFLYRVLPEDDCDNGYGAYSPMYPAIMAGKRARQVLSKNKELIEKIKQ